MKALIAGGAGFLGSHLCDRLIAEGWHVTCVDDASTGSADNVSHLTGHPRFEYHSADVSQGWLPAGEELDWVLHLASPASPVAYGSMPVHTLRAGSYGTFNLLELAKEDGAKFLLTSTSEVYGDPKVHPQPESYWGNVNPVGWRSCYDEAKRFAEAATVAFQKENGLDVRIARIFNTYGPRMRLDDGRPIMTFAVAALQGKPLPVQGDGEQTRSFCYVDDMIDGLRGLMDSGYQKPMNLGVTIETTILDLAKLVIRLVGSDSEIEFVKRVEDDPQIRRPDTTLAKNALGWNPTTRLEDGIAATIEWARDQLKQRGEL